MLVAGFLESQPFIHPLNADILIAQPEFSYFRAFRNRDPGESVC